MSAKTSAQVAKEARDRWTRGPLRLIRVEELGVVPSNRGGLGVSRHHAHEVALSIKEDGLSSERFHNVTVVQIPDTHLKNFRDFNEKMCSEDGGLPPFSPKMRFACLTKFLHRTWAKLCFRKTV